MAKDKTQDEMRSEYIALLKETIKKIEAIDKETPWSEREPKWWLSMSALETQMHKDLKAHQV